MKYISLFIISLLLSGCLHPGIVKVYQEKETGGHRIGTGVVINKNFIITAHHVIRGEGKCTVRIPILHNRIHFKKRALPLLVRNYKNIEPVVLMQPTGDDIDYEFNKDSIFKIGEGEPYKAITRRGDFLWENYRPKPGDSGSAIVTKHGELVGILYGHRKDKTPIYLRVGKNILEYIGD